MPATYTTLRLVDTAPGGDTIDLTTSGSGFALQQNGWSPGMPRLRQSPLGSLGAFSEVNNDLAIDVYADDAATLLQRVKRLALLLGRIDAIDKGGRQAPIRLEAQIIGSSHTNPLYATISGGGKADSVLDLPASYHDKAMSGEIEGAKLRFKRHGLWYEQAEESAAVNDVSGGYIAPLTFPTSSDVPSPFRVDVNFENATSLNTATPGYLITAKSGNVKVYGETEYTGNGSWASITAPSARNGVVMRHSGSAPFVYVQNALGVGQGDAWRRIAVIAHLRSNGAGTWRIRARAEVAGSTIAVTPWRPFDATSPKVVLFEPMSLPVPPTKVGVDAAWVPFSASPGIEIDTLTIVAMNTNTSRVLYLPFDGDPGNGLVGGRRFGTLAWHTRNRAGIELTYGLSDTVVPLSYTGAADLTMTGADASVLYIGGQGPITTNPSATPYWSWYNGSSRNEFTVTGIKTPAFMVPE